MENKEQILKILELVESGKLTPEEAAEQQALRAEYLAELRASLRGTLDNTVLERPDGSREKLQKKQ